MFSKLSKLFKKTQFSSKEYWERRYQAGGNSGSGSYGRLADFKASVINDFVKQNNVNSVVEFGCGDGNQLQLATYKSYIGLDVSGEIIKQCIRKFVSDKTKSFFLYDTHCFSDNRGIFKCDMAMSIDVLYHLVEDDIFIKYILDLFSSAKDYVVIYSSNEEFSLANNHEKHRKFTDYVNKLVPGWELYNTIDNAHRPTESDSDNGSVANFYFFRRKIQ